MLVEYNLLIIVSLSKREPKTMERASPCQKWENNMSTIWKVVYNDDQDDKVFLAVEDDTNN
jgi:hypothetical protein